MTDTCDNDDLLCGDESNEGKVNHNFFSLKTFMSYSGPGFLIAIAYLDPGNLEADLQVEKVLVLQFYTSHLIVDQAGSYSKYKLMWVLVLSLCIGLVLQAMSIRMGVYTGKHLAQLCRY